VTDDHDDPFERAVAREQELLGDRDSDPDPLTLDFEQVRRVVDEGLDPELVRDILDLGLAMSTDDILDLLVDHDAELEFFQGLAVFGDMSRKDAERLLDEDISPSAIARVRDAAPEVTIADAVALANEGVDLDELADDIERFGLGGLTGGQMLRLMEEGIDLDDFARVRDALDVSFDEAVERATAGGRNVTVGVSFRAGGTHQAWGAGRQRITKDGRVRGVWLGSLFVLPGVRAEIDALVIGDLIVGEGADVTITGRVTGEVRNEGGQVSVKSMDHGGTRA
jgi:hypothetical protein